MAKPNILVNLPPGFFTHAELAPCMARLAELGEIRRTSHNTPAEIAPDLPWCDSVLMWSWPRLLDEQLDLAKRLKFAAQLDVSQSAAKVAMRRGLPISHGRYGWSPAVAEMALTLILTMLRRTGEYHHAMRAGNETWVRAFPDDIDPLERELTGRPVGIVGFGRIGRRLAELLSPFRCPLSVSDPFVDKGVLDSFGAHALDLDELFSRNDIVVLCAASNDGTRALVGARLLEKLRPGALFVNVCRAALVDTEALVARLARGDVSAAVDVFDIEPCPPDHPLRRLPNAYLTPHRAGGLMASVVRILNWLIDDTEAFFAGRERKHNLHAGMIDALDT
jgi:phosphoglycerate dehydrogenase-like enzyme